MVTDASHQGHGAGTLRGSLKPPGWSMGSFWGCEAPAETTSSPKSLAAPNRATEDTWMLPGGSLCGSMASPPHAWDLNPMLDTNPGSPDPTPSLAGSVQLTGVAPSPKPMYQLQASSPSPRGPAAPSAPGGAGSDRAVSRHCGAGAAPCSSVRLPAPTRSPFPWLPTHFLTHFHTSSS